MKASEFSLKSDFTCLLVIGILLNMPGLWLDVMEPDGALYATIAKHVAQHNDWINLYGDGHDWLDKPHFPFWMAALSYKLLGLSGFAYKLPAFLFWLLGIRYTYLLARDLFNGAVARISVLIYVVALHSTLANFDVRAEPYLTTCILAGIWHMLVVYQRGVWIHIFAAALAIGCAMMTKGIFVLVTIGGGWIIFWVITRQWGQFLNFRWYVMIVLSFIFILPELYALYVQFDLHPEKVVFGRTQVSGLRFFFWDSQFGRFFNTGPIRGRGEPTFFLHTTLWAFLPWSFSLIGGVVYLIAYDKNRDLRPWIIYGSTLLTFVMFSLSKFQLPHYIVILFPFFAMISGYFLYQISAEKVLQKLAVAQNVLMYLLAILIFSILYFTNMRHGWVCALILTGILAFHLYFRQSQSFGRLFYSGYTSAAMLYIFLFLFFYPFLLHYQSGAKAARDIPVSGEGLPVASYRSFSYAFEFYTPGGVNLLRDSAQLHDFINDRPCFLYTSAAVGDSLLTAGLNAKILGSSEHFHITKLKLGFLDHRKRSDWLEKRYLLFIRD